MDFELVPYQKDFLPKVFEWRQQEAMLLYNPLKELSLTELQTQLENEGNDLSHYSDFSDFRWYIKKGNYLVGNVSLKNINRMMNYAEIGYTLDENFHGQGIGKKAVREVIKKIFHETPIRRIIALVHHQNIPSCRILEGLGFVREGRLREHFRVQDVYVDELFYGLLKEEFRDH